VLARLDTLQSQAAKQLVSHVRGALGLLGIVEVEIRLHREDPILKRCVLRLGQQRPERPDQRASGMPGGSVGEQRRGLQQWQQAPAQAVRGGCPSGEEACPNPAVVHTRHEQAQQPADRILIGILTGLPGRFGCAGLLGELSKVRSQRVGHRGRGVVVAEKLQGAAVRLQVACHRAEPDRIAVRPTAPGLARRRLHSRRQGAYGHVRRGGEQLWEPLGELRLCQLQVLLAGAGQRQDPRAQKRCRLVAGLLESLERLAHLGGQTGRNGGEHGDVVHVPLQRGHSPSVEDLRS
jgi:hypothetical protein